MAKNPKLSGLDSFNLMLALVCYLLDREEVPIEELALQFGVSKNDILKALHDINVSEFLSGSFYTSPISLDYDDFDDRSTVWLRSSDYPEGMPRLTAKQVAALQAGLQYLSSLPGLTNTNEVSALMEKLGRGVGEQVTNTLHVIPGTVDADAILIREAISTGRRLRFEYRDAAGVATTRELDPIVLESQNENWLVFGWCHTKNSGRHFRLDRMTATEILTDPICAEALELELPESIFNASNTDVVVKFEIEPEAHALKDEFMLEDTVELLANGNELFTTPISNLAILGPIIARFGGHAKVIEPAEARRIVYEYALSTLGEVPAESTRRVE